MSNIIPMVSSSPPPIDDSGGFGWDDDDDDFGTFASADNSFQTPGKTDSPVGNSFMNSVPDNNTNEDGDFADFEAFSSETTNEVSFPTINNSINEDELDKHPVIEDQIDEIDAVTSSKDDKYVNSEITLSDSGVYSSNISPVQQCDTNTQCKHNIDELDCNNSMVPSTDSVLDIVDEPKSVDELDDSLMETCQAHSNIPYDDATPQVVCNDDFKSTDVETSDNFPQTEHNNSPSHVNIPNSDSSSSIENKEHMSNGTDCKNEDSLSCVSPESDKDIKCDTIESDNVSGKVDNGEQDSCQNPSQSDLNYVSDLNSDNLDNDIDDDKCVPNVLQHENVDNSPVTKSSSDERLSISDELNNGQETTVISKEVNSSKISNVETIVSNTDSNTETPEDSEEVTKVTNDEFNAFTSETHEDSVDVVKVNDDDDCDNVRLTEDTSELIEISEGSEKLAIDDSVKNNTNETSNTVEDSEKEISVETNNVNETGLSVETSDNDDFEDFNTSSTFNNVKDSVANSGNNDDDEDDFGDFSQNVTNTETDSDINVKTNKEDDEVGELSKIASNTKSLENNDDNVIDDDDDFGDFSANFSNTNAPADDNSFGDFNATFETQEGKSDEQSNDWAAFSEPQIVTNTDTVVDDDDDEWAGFADDDDVKEKHEDSATTSVPVSEHHSTITPDHLAHMSKQEKLIYAVTTCFPSLVDADTNNSDNDTNLSEFTLVSDSCNVWSHVKGQRTTDALTYQWTKSQWNAQLFSTLHIDTKNILIGHKKTVVPVFAAGLTLLEPTKGSTSSLKPHVLVDTSKSDNTYSSQPQISTSTMRSNQNESIPAAQFDWTGSGLTNPLEANNKTLNLDFLIQDQATKSSALESEFMGTSEESVYKPTIQPLENILANLKPASTFKPTNQNEAYSEEASKIVQSLPDLSFMTSKVLMFPVRIDGF